MSVCDVCSAPTSFGEGTTYSPDEFRTLVAKGFEPEGGILPGFALDSWKHGVVAQSTTPWLLCPRCAAKAARYLPKAAGTGPGTQKLTEQMSVGQLLGLATPLPPSFPAAAPSGPAAPPVIPTPKPTEEPAKIGAFGRLIGVLMSPGETFADIARKPSWIVPWIFLTLTGLAISYALVQRVDWVEASRKGIERVSFTAHQFEQLPPEQREQALQSGAVQAKVMRYVRGAVGSLLLILIMGGIYLGVFNLIGRAGLNYKTACTMVAYAYVPVGLRELIAVPVVFLKEAGTIDPENFLASNLAAFLPSDAKLWQVALGASLDLFGIWTIILLAIGFAAANPQKLSFGKSLGLVIGVFAAFLLLGLGLALIFG